MKQQFYENSNKMLVILSATFTFSAWLCQATATQLCTTEKLQECYDLFNKDGLPSATVLYFSEEVMTEHCRRYRIFSECMKTIQSDCRESRNTSFLAYQGLDDAYGFLCGDGFKEYVKYQSSCYKEEDVQFEAKTCSNVFSGRSIYLKTNVTDKKYARARYCQYVDDYIDCVYNLLQSFCGDLAAKWHKSFDTKSVQPTMVAFGCSGWPISEKTDASNNTAAILMISLGAAIVVTGSLVAIGLTILVCSRCRCRRRPNHRRSISVDMPPPYAPPFNIFQSEEERTTQSRSPLMPPRSRTPSSDSSGSIDNRRNKLSVSKSPRCKKKRNATASNRSRSNSSDDESRIAHMDRLLSTGSRTSAEVVPFTGLMFESNYDSVEGAVGGPSTSFKTATAVTTSSASSSSSLSSPFVRPYVPPGHFEMPSPGSSILSYLQSSDDDTTSLLSHTCDYY